MKKTIYILFISALSALSALGQTPKTKAQLKARFDVVSNTSTPLQHRFEMRRNVHDGDAYWALFQLESNTLMFQATGDFSYLESWLTTWYAWQDQAVPANTFPNASVPSVPHGYDFNPNDIEHSLSGGVYNDAFLDWDNHGLRVQAWKQGDTDGGTYPLFQGHGMRTVPRMLLVLKNNPTIRATSNGTWPGATYETQYQDILAFWQQNMWNKWWTRGPSNTIMRENTHMASHWSSVGFFLNKITPNANQALAVTAWNTNVSLLDPSRSGSMRGNLRLYNFTSGQGYIWHSPWGSTSGSNDIPHAGAEMRFIVDQMMWPDSYWNETDKGLFLKTAHSIIDRDVNPEPWPFRIDPTNPETTKNYHQLYYYGWPSWGRFDPSLQLKYENSRLYNETSTGRHNNAMIFIANLVYNRAYIEGSLVYPEFTTGSVSVTDINFTNKTQTIREGETLDKSFTFTPVNPTNTNVSFLSTNSAVIDQNGTWVGVGSAFYSVTAQDGGFQDVITVTAATTAATGATVTPSAFTLVVGNTTQLSGDAIPTTATIKTGTWQTDNAPVATVNASGLVTGIASGAATITFTTTDGSFTDASVITVVGSVPDNIPSLVFLSPETVDPAVTVDGTTVTTWEDISGNGLNAVGVGGNVLNVSPNGRQVEFSGTSYFYLPDDPRLNFQMGVDNFTLIVREGDIIGSTSGYLLGKVDSGPFTPQYGIAYGGGVLNGVYGGGILSGFTNVPQGTNRLIIAVYTGPTVNVWIDGTKVLTNGTVGTAMATGQRVNLGGRTDGSYLANAGSMMDVARIIPSALNDTQRIAIEGDLIIGTAVIPAHRPKRLGRTSNDRYFYLSGTKKVIN